MKKGVVRGMKKTQLFRNICCMLVFLLLIVSTTFHHVLIAEQNDTNPSTMNDSSLLEVEKLVKDGDEWVKSVEVSEGDVVEYKIIIYNPSDDYEIHWSGVIFEDLPCNLEYIPESTNGLPLAVHPDPEFESEEIDWVNNSVLWRVDKDSPVLPKEYLNFTYLCKAVCCYQESGFLPNLITVSPSKFIHHCDPYDIIYNDGSLDESDSAYVKVICDIMPGVFIEKAVKDGCTWMDSITVSLHENIEFRLIINNTGNINLSSVQITDTFPSILKYNYDATVTPSSASDNTITWIIPFIGINESVEILYTAKAIGLGEGDNHASVFTCQGVHDSDSAHITVAGMIVEKKVWNQASETWANQIDASVGDTIIFKIIVSYIGSDAYGLYNIKIRDELPDCLSYAYNSNPKETSISSDGQTIWWNLSVYLEDGEQTSIQFDAYVLSTGCGACINLANVTANECSGSIFYGGDTVQINIECPVIADAEGPYHGTICTNILIQGSASGGKPPYTYQWDLTDNGLFNDKTTKSFYHSWDESGSYPIHLKVIDSEGRSDIDSTLVIIAPAENNPPSTPSKPVGETDGLVDISYSYTTSSFDNDDDLIRYGWDWTGNDVVDEWTAFYPSGEVISTSHQWNTPGTYFVKVIAEDQHGLKSDYSLVLIVEIKTQDNLPPSKPDLSGPSQGRIGVTYTFHASSVDPEGNDLYYLFDWGDGTTSGWIGPFSSGQTASQSHTWVSRGSFSVKVKARDAEGLESVWSESLPVSMPLLRRSLFEERPLMVQWLSERFILFQLFFDSFDW